MDPIEYHPIGIIHTSFKTPEGTPIQPIGARDSRAEINIYPDFAEGLADLTGFSHIILLYHFHLSKQFTLKVKPFLDDAAHGLFATRAPSRPNAIGLSVVRLVEIEASKLIIKDADVVDRIGWLAEKSAVAGKTVADKRFVKKQKTAGN